MALEMRSWKSILKKKVDGKEQKKRIEYENNGCISKAQLVEETKLMPFN